VPEHHIGEIIDSLSAERFGHPDALAADLAELTARIASLDELIAERFDRFERLGWDQPELDDFELHREWQIDADAITVWGRRRAEDMGRAVALRERLAGEEPPADEA
jgi:hypothetical protein